MHRTLGAKLQPLNPIAKIDLFILQEQSPLLIKIAKPDLILLY